MLQDCPTNLPHCFKKCNRPRLQAATLLSSYDLNTVSLNDKHVKSLRRISSLKTIFRNSEAVVRKCYSKQVLLPVNIEIFLRKAFCMKHFRWLLLKMVEEFQRNSNLT